MGKPRPTGLRHEPRWSLDDNQPERGVLGAARLVPSKPPRRTSLAGPAVEALTVQRRTLLGIGVLAWGAPMLGLGVALWLTPNVVTGEADAGTFVRAEAHPGGFWSPGIQTVQTTRGTLAAADFFTAERDEPLMIVDTSVRGLQVCNRRDPPTCSPLDGRYLGQLTPVAHAPVWLTDARRRMLDTLMRVWGWLTLAGFALAMILAKLGRERGADDSCDADRCDGPQQ